MSPSHETILALACKYFAFQTSERQIVCSYVEGADITEDVIAFAEDLLALGRESEQ